MRLANVQTKKSVLVWAFLDSCSDKDFIDLKIAEEIGIDLTEEILSVATVEGRISARKQLGDVSLSSINRKYEAEVGDAVFATFPTASNDLPPSQRDLSKFQHLADIEFPVIPGRRIGMIISAAHHGAWLGGEVRRGKHGEPNAFLTDFGWTMSGATGKKGERDLSTFKIAVDDQVLREGMDRIFMSDFPVEKVVSDEYVADSKDAREALEQLERSARFDDEKGKYISALTWKGGREAAAKKLNAVDSQSMALKRLSSLKRSMMRDPDKKAKAFEQVKKFIENGRAEVVDENEMREKPKDRVQWRLPGHLVHQNQKWRFCHDGRASVDGICLNEELIGAMNLLTPILDPVMHLRKWKHALTTDIEAFFHNILVDDADKDAFLFYWFEDESMKRRILIRFLAHIFGATSSPMITSYILRLHAERIKNVFGPEVYEVIKRYFYVDDGTAGANTTPAVQKLKIDLEEAMRRGGFRLAKWKSNSPQILGLPEVEEKDRYTKVLGVGWDLKEDRLFVPVDDDFGEKEADTPRDVVTATAKIFDPLGIVAPAILPGRRWTQLCMRGKWGWDVALLKDVKKGFNSWARTIRELSKISIPRWWDDESTLGKDVQLHCFSDAAEDGFGSVCYRRVDSGEPGVPPRVDFVLGKCHVVPLDSSKTSHHNLTPRLELVAAVKSTQLQTMIVESVKMPFSRVVFWTDSEICVKQINNSRTRYGPFHRNRLSKIHAVSTPDQWMHVDGKLNPADICSRGIKVSDKEQWDIYLNGPAFLKLPEDQWPAQKAWGESEPECNIAAVETEPEENPLIWDVIAKPSEWEGKKRRVGCLVKIARIWRKIASTRKTRSRKNRVDKSLGLTMEEREEAEAMMVKAIQEKHFRKEIKLLTAAGTNSADTRKELRSNSSKLFPLNPFIGDDGALRSGSRLTSAPIAYEQKFPKLLPKEDPNVPSLVRRYHRTEMHAGVQQTLAAVRRKFWLLQGQSVVKKALKICPDCQRAHKKPQQQKMGPLPEDRVKFNYIFERTGVDLMGPFLVKRNGRANHKCWVVVFTCMAARAVHTEVVFNLDASAMLNALNRFTSRRPGVKKLISDNGSNLRAAATILKKELKKLNEDLQPSLHKVGLEWEFIPPRNPHRGGVWERIIGIFKAHMATALSSGDVPQIDTFITTIIAIESVINRRPLTSISSDPRDSIPLSVDLIMNPALLNEPPAGVIIDNVKTEADKTKFRWKQSLSRLNTFTKLFLAEYLSILANRPKWRTTEIDLKIDDLVIIVDETKKRRTWETGRVTKTEGTGSHVRRVSIRRPGGEVIRRDRSGVVLLELELE